MSLLEVRGLSVQHGGIRAVENVAFFIEKGEAVVLIGANGAGKSSLLRAVLGLCPSSSEVMRFDGSELNNLDTRQRLALGISLVPETKALFLGMTVEDNLKLGLFLRQAEAGFAEAWKRVSKLFPGLLNKLPQRAGTLSGGEQQMVAIARALMQQPRLLCLDEPSLGLAPKIVDALYSALAELKKQGVSLLLVEQQARRALDFGTRGYVLNVGKIVRSGLCNELAADKFVANAYLGHKIP
jgi:branched-chain amino acid transport system ATP-binding protein